VDGSGEPFFVLNCDVISMYPFAELIRFHKSHGGNGEATIMVTKVVSPLRTLFRVEPFDCKLNRLFC
jgi:mannose-1-phosphate guanylyltransferase